MANEEQPKHTVKDPKSVRDPKTGQFLPGNRTGGRPKGSVDGVALLRALFDRHMREMCEDGKEFDTLLKQLRTKPGGVYELFRLGMKVWQQQQRAQEQGVNIGEAGVVNVIMYQEEPPPARVVENTASERQANNGRTLPP